jgi:hypothetical protein
MGTSAPTAAYYKKPMGVLLSWCLLFALIVLIHGLGCSPLCFLKGDVTCSVSIPSLLRVKESYFCLVANELGNLLVFHWIAVRPHWHT